MARIFPESNAAEAEHSIPGINKEIFKTPRYTIKKKNPLSYSLEERGVIGTCKILLSYVIDSFFDIKHGTDTFSWVELENLGIDHQKKETAEKYQPTNARAMRNLFKKIAIPPNKVLVDLGCGKGRVLLIASEFGFREVRGIELSPVLCDIAKKNCSNYKDRTGTKTSFQIIQSDVLDYEFKDDEEIFFMFNPFNGEVLRDVLQRITESFLRRKRKIWIIYRYPVHREIIENNQYFKKTKEYQFLGHDFMVFTNGETEYR